MAEDTVTLIALNGMQVSVAASKKDRLLVDGYRVPTSSDETKSPPKRPAKKAASSKSEK